MNVEQIDYLGVRISHEGFANMYGARTEKLVPRDEISQIELKYGRVGERSWFQLAFGLLCLGIAAWQFLGILIWIFGGGTLSGAGVLIMGLLLGIGGWAVWDSLRKQWYFDIETTNMKKQKIAFDGKVDDDALKAFVQQARQMGYQVQ